MSNTRSISALPLTINLDYYDPENDENDVHFTLITEFYLFFPIPFVLCPEYGCRAVANTCQSMDLRVVSEDLIPQYENSADKTYSYSIIPEQGRIGFFQGYTFLDKCKFASMKVTGDFTLIMHLPEGLGTCHQTGIMARASDLAFDRMVFMGREMGNGELYLYNRRKPREDNTPLILDATHNNHTCLRMDREGEKLTFYSAAWDSENGCPCENDDDLHKWGDKITVDFDDGINGWSGPIDIGIAAACGHIESAPPSPLTEIEVDNIIFVDKGHQLKALPTIINTAFSEGNLISNWSFENTDNFFGPFLAVPPQLYNPHFLEEAENAYEGRYFCRIQDKVSGHTLTSKKVPVYFERNGVQSNKLILKMMYRSNISGQALYPKIIIHNFDLTTTEPPLTEPFDLTSPGDWKEYNAEIDLTGNSIDACACELELIAADASFTGYMDFDNVQLYPYFEDIDNSKTASPPVTNISYADGMNQKFQVVARHSDKDNVSAMIIDAEGRPNRIVPSYIEVSNNDGNNLGEVKDDPIAGFSHYYTTGDIPRPYSSGTDISAKPLLSSFREHHGTTMFDKSPKNRKVKQLGRLWDKSADVEFTYSMDNLDELGSPIDGITPHHLISTTISSATGSPSDARIQKAYSNAYGQPVKTIVKGPQATEDLISTVEPDVLGRNWKVTSPLGIETEDDPDDFASTYNFNTWDQAVWAKDPDGGISESIFDKLGNMRLHKDAQKKLDNRIMAWKYDDYGRVIEVYSVNIEHVNYFSQQYADNPSWPDNTALDKIKVLQYDYDNIPTNTPDEIKSEMNYLKGRISATHSLAYSKNVSKYFSYDVKGRIKNSWIQIEGIPLQKKTFTYNQQGQIILKRTEGGKPGNNAENSYVKFEKYAYDELNRLKCIWSSRTTEDNYKKVAEYEYWPDGKVRYKNFGESSLNPNNYSQSIAYKYDVASRLLFQRHEVYDNTTGTWAPSGQYEQTLAYNQQGNISSTSYMLPSGVIDNYARRFDYQYDHFNRLIRADYAESQGPGWGMVGDKFDGAYTYNKNGAIKTLARGPLANEDIGLHGFYHYQPGAHKLRAIGNRVATGGKDRSAIGLNNDDNYLYDANGNLIEDKGTLKRIKYDFRNLPIEIEQYTDNFASLKSTTTFVYDADGNRVAKFFTKKN